MSLLRFLAITALGAAIVGCAADLGGDAPRDPRLLQLASASAAGTGGARVAARMDETRMVMADGAELPLQRWLPAEPPRAAVLALHGFNDYANAFREPARLLNANGIAIYAYDQRGFGGAPGRGQWPGRQRLTGDVTTAARLVRERHPDLPVFLMGESMGGAIAVLAMTAEPEPPEVDGVILVAPAVWGRQTMSWMHRAALFMAQFMPAVQLSQRSLPVTITPSDNVAMLRAFNADPMVIKHTRADAVAGLVDVMSEALQAAPRFKIPSLVLYGDRDDIVPPTPVMRFIEELPPTPGLQRAVIYPNGYHMLLRDLQGETVTRDIVAWILQRAGGLPSLGQHVSREVPLPHVDTLHAALP